MNIVFRTDAYFEIGSGHVMRCLTLAKRLSRRGCKIVFVMRDFPQNLIKIVEAEGYSVIRLPFDSKMPFVRNQYSSWLGTEWREDAEVTKSCVKALGSFADWLIIDHYGIDYRWEQFLRPYTGKIMVIDDLANRPHDCDILLDQNLYHQAEIRYKDLVPGYCRFFLGPQFALLRDEFIEARKRIQRSSGDIRKVLVFFGGSDPTNETEKAVTSLLQIDDNKLAINVILGSLNENLITLKNICSVHSNIKIHQNINTMAQLISDADIAIGAGGTTTWERGCLGLPTLTVSIADNQHELLECAHDKGLLYYMGISQKISSNDYGRCVKKFIQHPEMAKTIKNNCLNLFRDYEDKVEILTEALVNA